MGFARGGVRVICRRGVLRGLDGGVGAARRGDAGALYHHFANKRDLFRALVEELEEELEELLLGLGREAHEKSGDAGEAFAAEFGRVLFVDGPSALGREEWHEIDARCALAQTEAGLRPLFSAGRMEGRPVEPLARLLHGASIEAALYVAAAEDKEGAKQEVREAMGWLLGGMGSRG